MASDTPRALSDGGKFLGTVPFAFVKKVRDILSSSMLEVLIYYMIKEQGWPECQDHPPSMHSKIA